MIFRNLCLMVVGAGLTVTACDKTTVREASGNGTVYADLTADRAVAGQDITINRFRIMKSTGNGTSPGDASIRDVFYIDMWATLAGEAKPRYAKQGPFLADADGNLYAAGKEPGSIVYSSTLAGTTALGGVGEAISYTRTGTDGLIDEEYDGVVETQSVVTGAAGANITTTTKVIVKPSAQDASFVNLRTRSYAEDAIFSRTRYENNTTGTVKGKLGCMNTVTTTATANTALAATPTWYSVELGNIVSDKDGVTASTQTATADGSASDQILWVKWTENWYVTGVNVNSHVVRMVRERSAPFYLSRELVGRTIAIAAGGAAAPSGFETMIRACSLAAADGTGTTTTFKLSSPAATADTTKLTGFSRALGSATPTCTALNSVAATVALTGAYTAAPFSCNANYASGTLGGLTFGLGTWNGTYSASVLPALGSGGNTAIHVEHSAIVESTF
jgi:hypothetical protein